MRQAPLSARLIRERYAAVARCVGTTVTSSCRRRACGRSATLVHHDRELAVLDAKSWGKRPVKITIDEPSLVDPGLLLFAAFAVRQLADDASATAGGASAAAATG